MATETEVKHDPGSADSDGPGLGAGVADAAAADSPGGTRAAALGDPAPRYTALEAYKPAPKWMVKYLKTLVNIVSHKRPLHIVVAPQAWFDAMPRAGKAEGALMMLADGTDVIIIPERAKNTSYWWDIIAHEFAHALHTPIDRMVYQGNVDPVAYEHEVEHFTAVVGGLAQFAALHGRFRP